MVSKKNKVDEVVVDPNGVNYLTKIKINFPDYC